MGTDGYTVLKYDVSCLLDNVAKRYGVVVCVVFFYLFFFLFVYFFGNITHLGFSLSYIFKV